MKLDAKLLRYLSSDHFRVLTATEMGSRNHEVVPTKLIEHIAKLKQGGVHKILADLAKYNLVARVQNAKYDGYRLTYGGYDYLALRTLAKRGSIYSVGQRIGVGKESDIMIVANENEEQMVLKMHRLGRTSFRNIKSKRDYLRGKSTSSWLYMARLAAMKEFAFMQVLYDNGFPVPKPIDMNRHCIVMELVDAFPLCQISECGDPGKLYSELMNLIVRLAKSGLIHGDFNEFNLMITSDNKPVLIDFPQMVSTSHINAQDYFNRDVDCIRTFFKKRFRYESVLYPKFKLDTSKEFDLDVQVAASGFTEKDQQVLEAFFATSDDAKCSSTSDAESDFSSSDAESEELEQEFNELTIDDSISTNKNRDFKPFRDQKKKLTSQDIKELVSKGLKSEAYSSRKRNSAKAVARSAVKTAVKTSAAW